MDMPADGRVPRGACGPLVSGRYDKNQVMIRMAKKTAKKTGKRRKKSPSLIRRTASSIGGLLARHPAKLGGPVVFGVVFSFVSANALWYQPGPHPSPMMKTRLPSDPYSVPGRRKAAATDFETFRIELEEGGRQDKPEDDLIAILEQVEANPPPVAADAPAPVEETPAAAPAEQPVDILALQQALAARGYYKAKPDGVTGPMTEAAIKAFQADEGIAVTGKADGALMALVSMPLPKPRSQTVPSADPVAELLEAEDEAPAIEISAADPMVIEIQRGLINIAYDGVVADGVAGNTTREAILEFQKHYRLPETGEPSASVRDKLIEIGAL